MGVKAVLGCKKFQINKLFLLVILAFGTDFRASQFQKYLKSVMSANFMSTKSVSSGPIHL